MCIVKKKIIFSFACRSPQGIEEELRSRLLLSNSNGQSLPQVIITPTSPRTPPHWNNTVHPTSLSIEPKEVSSQSFIIITSPPRRLSHTKKKKVRPCLRSFSKLFHFLHKSRFGPFPVGTQKEVEFFLLFPPARADTAMSERLFLSLHGPCFTSQNRRESPPFSSPVGYRFHPFPK